MAPNKETINNCARVIVNILATTELDEQDKVCEIAKIMHESAKINDDYTTEMVKIYELTYKFLKVLSSRDFEKVLTIFQEK